MPDNPQDDATVITVENPTPPDNSAALEQIGGRIEALETRITEAVEGERTWTTETITSLRQELADLRANLSEITQGFPAQVTELREELTRLSLSLQTPVVIPVEEVTAEVVTPPASPASEEGTPTDAPVTSASPKGKRRVV